MRLYPQGKQGPLRGVAQPDGCGNAPNQALCRLSNEETFYRLQFQPLQLDQLAQPPQLEELHQDESEAYDLDCG